MVKNLGVNYYEIDTIPLPKAQETTLNMDITKWSIPKSDIFCSQRWRSSIQSAKARPEADCGSHHQLFISKFRLKLKKVRNTTTPFRYYLNQITYDYTVEVTNRFKGLDLKECLKNYGWIHNILPEAMTKTIPKKNKCKKAK